MTERNECPTAEVDPENFLTNEDIEKLLETKDEYKFKQEDYYKLYNCVHCNECGTSEERMILKQKFLEDGNIIEGLNDVMDVFKEYNTPFKLNKSRIKSIPGVCKESDTLLYLGCFTTVKAPKFGENAIKYLLQKGVDFCIEDEEICCGYPVICTGEQRTYHLLVERNRNFFKSKGYKKIITVCPSCYMVFKKEYADLNIKVEFITDYLEPSVEKKSGSVSIQHACPLKNGEIPGVDKKIERILIESGYEVQETPHWCCGGGVGHQLRVDIAEKIANIRVKDFKGDYVAIYCPDCIWFINVFGRKNKLKLNIKDVFELLM